MTPQETRIIENFMGTIPADATIDETTRNGEADARAYGLSTVAARELGRRIRAHFVQRPQTRGERRLGVDGDALAIRILLSDIGIRALWCASCRGGNPVGVGEPDPEACRHCGATPFRDIYAPAPEAPKPEGSQ